MNSKKECFFVWRGFWSGKLHAEVTWCSFESQRRLASQIARRDPFQGGMALEAFLARSVAA